MVLSPTSSTIPAPRPVPTDTTTPLNTWLTSFASFLSAPSEALTSSLFFSDGYLRDHLCLSWDFKTAHQLPAIYELLSSRSIKSVTLSSTRPVMILPIDAEGQVPAITAFLDIATKHGRGEGVLKLLEDGPGEWKAYSLFTALTQLDAYPEKTLRNRPSGVPHESVPGKVNWADTRKRELEFLDEQPAVIVIGAGQGGLSVAARLKMMGIPTLVVEQNERVGDNWRNRYRHLVLHDPVQFDHLPYLPFPSFWPTYTPKDKLADWLETYADALELNIWTSSRVSASTWNEATKSWTVTISREGHEDRKLQPRHIVLATGATGPPKVPAIVGEDTFKGQYLHSAHFVEAQPHSGGKKAVVIGSGNSGHDIAQDYYEKGWDVTIVQRGSTCVVSGDALVGTLMKGLYDEDGPPTDMADLIFHSFPLALLKRNHILATKVMEEKDRKILDGLRNVGFALDNGPDDSGLMMKYLQIGGGYYIDVGASTLIGSGAIKHHRISKIVEILPNGIKFDSGTLAADEIVFATGYGGMVTTAKDILGEEALENVDEVWGFDENDEIKGMWKQARKGLGLWFMGGNFALTRWGSRAVALGIGALETELLN